MLADVARGVVLDGRYRIEDVIGQGGMATVYRARDEVLNRDVAIKLFPPTPDADEILRHKAEMHVLARLSHPNLVMLHDAGSARAGGPLQQTYLVMELVPGPTLADLLATGPLSPQHTARVGRQLAEALSTVHEADVVHRDIKPANVLIVDREAATREQPDAALTTGPIVKIADFGIARFADGARLTMTGTTLGTATYLSPEQASGGTVGTATDVYALGLVLLECLTGAKAFTGTVVEVAAARLARDPAIPDEVGEEWTALLRDMTCRDPEQRLTMAEAAARMAQMDGGTLTTGEVPTTQVILRPADPHGAEPPAASPGAPARTSVRPPQRPARRTRAPRAEDEQVGRTRPLSIAQLTRGRGTDARAGQDGAEPSTGLRRSRRLVVLAALTVLLVVATALVVDQNQPDPAPPAPQELPAVPGTLGEAIDELSRSVQP